MKPVKLFGLSLMMCSTTLMAQLDTLKDPMYCGGCHQRIYKEWSSSMMGTDLNNDKVYQFYTGTNPAGQDDGLGFKPLMHGATGDCADCHVPELVLSEHKEGREVDLGEAMREKLDHGISCHFCHSVADVKIHKDANGRYKTRIMDTVTQDKSGVIYGVRGEGQSTAHPIAKNGVLQQSEICATCHLNQEKFLSISQYDDWKQAFDSGKTDQTCQQCHMPLLEGKHQISDVEGSLLRDNVRAHTFIGANDLGMLQKALTLEMRTHIENGKLIVETTVENVGAGHKVPGSGPIRNVILKIDAVDDQGNVLTFAGDKRALLPPLAGFGNPKTKQLGANDWAGMPGKMYAKAYKSKPIAKMGNKPMAGVGGFMADSVLFDTALNPREPDHARFDFALPSSGKQVRVNARLVYRDAFKPLSDRKGWTLKQQEMLQKSQTITLR